MGNAAPWIELSEVTFRYGARTVVDRVSLSLSPGRFLGLLGPNGAGKSTLIRLIAGLLRPTAGTVRLAGQDLRRLSRREIARHIALLPQDTLLPPGFTVREIVVMGRTPHLSWSASEGAVEEEIAQRALEMAGAQALASRHADELSGGERQRVLLARTLAQEPDILLLDEPTTHLDIRHQLATLNILRSQVQSADLAVLGVFHDLNLAAEYCDSLVFLAEGRIVACGEPATVLTAERIHQVYGVCVPVVQNPESGRPAVLPPAAPGTAPPAAEAE